MTPRVVGVLCCLWAAAAHAQAPSYVSEVGSAATEGPYGVLFSPRYRTVEEALVQRQRDLAASEAAAEASTGDARRDALEAVRARDAAVRHWIDRLTTRVHERTMAADDQAALLDQVALLRLEADALAVQAQHLGAGALVPSAPAPESPTPPSAHAPDDAPVTTLPEAPTRDAIAFGRDVRIGAGEHVRDAVALGGDVVIAGTVHRHATALGGDVTVQPGGKVLGERTAVGGDIVDHTTPPTPQASAEVPTIVAVQPVPRGLFGRWLAALVPFFALLGAGVLTVGLVPQRVSRVADAVSARPWMSSALGVSGSLAMLGGAVLFALSIVGIPLAVLLILVWASAWMLGFVAVCQAIGERLPFDHPEAGRWAAFALGAVIVWVASSLPWLGGIIIALGSILGVGAALSTRLGGRG